MTNVTVVSIHPKIVLNVPTEDLGHLNAYVKLAHLKMKQELVSNAHHNVTHVQAPLQIVMNVMEIEKMHLIVLVQVTPLKIGRDSVFFVAPNVKLVMVVAALLVVQTESYLIVHVQMNFLKTVLIVLIAIPHVNLVMLMDALVVVLTKSYLIVHAQMDFMKMVLTVLNALSSVLLVMLMDVLPVPETEIQNQNVPAQMDMKILELQIVQR